MKFWLALLLCFPALGAVAGDDPAATGEPQKAGWPLTVEERAFIVEKPEHERRPGRLQNKHLPQFWPVVPSAGYFGGDAWLRLHEAHVKTVQANRGPVDVLLVGDSITIQRGGLSVKHFPQRKPIDIDIGSDKTQNVLWRLDHGGVARPQPKAIVLMIGNSNMFFEPEAGIEAAVQGIEICVKNLREKFPESAITLAKIWPPHAAGNCFHEDIKKTNATMDPVQVEADLQVCVIDLRADFINADAAIKEDLFTPADIHRSTAGYAVYAAKVKPILRNLTR